jgi:hypothetical protein
MSILDILEQSLYNLAPLHSMKKAFFELTVMSLKIFFVSADETDLR